MVAHADCSLEKKLKYIIDLYFTLIFFFAFNLNEFNSSKLHRRRSFNVKSVHINIFLFVFKGKT
jgi:hypothetical protein